MKTRVPETIACINCNHNVIIKLYRVDTTINSSQGRFHTVHNPGEPAYTVYCINCGHFMTNDPSRAALKPGPKAKPARSAPATHTTASAAKPTRKSERQTKDLPGPAPKQATKPQAKAGAAKATAKTTPVANAKKASPATKQKRPQRKKAK